MPSKHRIDREKALVDTLVFCRGLDAGKSEFQTSTQPRALPGDVGKTLSGLERKALWSKIR